MSHSMPRQPQASHACTAYAAFDCTMSVAVLITYTHITSSHGQKIRRDRYSWAYPFTIFQGIRFSVDFGMHESALLVVTYS